MSAPEGSPFTAREWWERMDLPPDTGCCDAGLVGHPGRCLVLSPDEVEIRVLHREVERLKHEHDECVRIVGHALTCPRAGA